MPFCTSCGAQIDESARFCASCGALAPSQETEPGSERLLHEDNGGDAAAHPETQYDPEPAEAPAPEPAYIPTPQAQEWQQPAQNAASRETVETRPPLAEPRQPFAPISTAKYFWTLLLFCIPGLGHLVAAVWALGAAKNPNRRNLAKAYLLLSLIGLVLIAAAYLLIRLFPQELLGWLPDSMYYGLRNFLNLW